ncbi:LiaF transmembrane domain-containing protein [Paenibacillus eucommiae]|uniref:Membrane protein n=1 Tax=Paenibacillus eucommiae TaxID=1355755 RepID=A0ABS4J125_9BACL|nr:hypothetical protein [Paenibacillus eucommiae]MBP1992956.1 putative membrane protein [Paenibacillus eucommiae]
MSINKKSGLALLLIFFGTFVLFRSFGFHFDLMGYVVPIAIAGLGYVGIKNGKKVGWFFAIFGLLLLSFKLSWLFSIVFAVLLIGFGVSMIKKQSPSNTQDW